MKLDPIVIPISENTYQDSFVYKLDFIGNTKMYKFYPSLTEGELIRYSEIQNSISGQGYGPLTEPIVYQGEIITTFVAFILDIPKAVSPASDIKTRKEGYITMPDYIPGNTVEELRWTQKDPEDMILLDIFAAYLQSKTKVNNISGLKVIGENIKYIGIKDSVLILCMTDIAGKISDFVSQN